MKWYLKLLYRIFKRYQRLELKFTSYGEADQLIRATANLPEAQRWVIAPEEDHNHIIGKAFIERRVRITG